MRSAKGLLAGALVAVFVLVVVIALRTQPGTQSGTQPGMTEAEAETEAGNTRNSVAARGDVTPESRKSRSGILPQIATVELLPPERRSDETEVRHENRLRLQRDFEVWVDEQDITPEQRRRTLVAIIDHVSANNAAVQAAYAWPDDPADDLPDDERRRLAGWRQHRDALHAELRGFLTETQVDGFRAKLHFGELIASPIVAVSVPPL